jgi:hypothetical protein
MTEVVVASVHGGSYYLTLFNPIVQILLIVVGFGLAFLIALGLTEKDEDHAEESNGADHSEEVAVFGWLGGSLACEILGTSYPQETLE